MTIAELLDDLESRGVGVRLEGDGLRCEGPDDALTRDVIDTVRSRRDEIVAHLHETPGPEAPLEGEAVRTFASCALHPESSAHQRATVLRVESVARPEALLEACRRLLGSESRLRRPIALRAATPTRAPAREVDVTGILESKRHCGDAKVRRWIDRQLDRAIDPGAGPLLAIRVLVDASEGMAWVVLQLHELGGGAARLTSLARRWWAIYRGADRPCGPDETGPARASDDDPDWAYWTSATEGLPAVQLPADVARPRVQSGRTGRHRFRVPAPWARALGRLSEPGDAGELALLTAFQLVVARRASAADLALAYSDGQAGVRLLRTSLDGAQTFREAHARTAQAVALLHEHPAPAFGALIQRIDPPRDPSRAPLAQIGFSLEPGPFPVEPGAPDAPIASGPERAGTHLDLALHASPEDDAFACRMLYDAALFTPGAIARLAAHLERVLVCAAEDPDIGLERLPALSEAERHELLHTWNQTESPFDRSVRVHELIGRRARQRPQAVALTCRGQELSYGELERCSNQLAHVLRSRGVAPDSLVGLCLDRGPDMVVALLAILKAGGAYLALDPSYPEDRIHAMVEDAGARLLVTQAAYAARYPGLQALCIDGLSETLAQQPAHPPQVEVRPETLIYAVYTSGSTGRPKGVLVDHLSVSNLIEQTNDICRVDESSRVLQFAPISFDVSVWEILKTLVAGARLVIAPDDLRLPGGPMETLLAREGVTHAAFPPFYLAMARAEGLDALAHLFVSFEPCPLEVYREWSRGRAFYNAYGPSEATVCATAHRCRDERDVIPIGVPGGNVTTYVVDEDLELVPRGVPGELLIGGLGLARGYLNRPDLTRAKFVSHPFSSREGERVYRTGDLVRHRENGDLVFIGRIDDQVKVRGFRIELGEIEARLARHPDVREAVAMAREDEPGNRRLVAYVIPEAGADPDAGELRAWLRARLPAFMVPALFASVDAFPLDPNGKVDRRALPPPRGEAPARPPFRAPATAMEERVAAWWQELLCVDEVGAADDFFEIGGHSLLAAAFLASLRERLGVELPPRTLLEAPTVSAVAAFLEVAEGGSGARH